MNNAEDSLLAGVKESAGVKTKTSFYSEIEEIPEILKRQNFPSLDGLMAVSIVIVIVFYIFIDLGHVATIFGSPLNFSFADFGVQIFFVISGFLITTLHLKEKVNKGDFNLKQFYIRRTLRILPVAFLYLFFVLMLNFVLKQHLNMLFILASFLFLRNLVANVTGPDNLTTHYWSLAVEEQFYLIFPVILKKSLRLFICFLAAILLLSLLSEVTNGSFLLKLSGRYFRIIRILITQFQGIAIGSFFSMAIFKNRISVAGSNLGYKISALILLVVLLTLYSCRPGRHKLRLL
jgi:peptidoglycan/LPS O-acetylase OafA/YrhL